MPSITIYIDPDCHMRLLEIAVRTAKPVTELAAIAVEEEALNFFRGRPDDPVRKARERAEAKVPKA